MTSVKKLLFIEDEGYVLDRVNGILAGFPQFEVTRTGGAAEAKALLGTGDFDIVLTDIYLRGVSGLELLYTALKARPDACVIIIAGVKDADLAAKALKEGAMDYV